VGGVAMRRECCGIASGTRSGLVCPCVDCGATRAVGIAAVPEPSWCCPTVKDLNFIRQRLAEIHRPAKRESSVGTLPLKFSTFPATRGFGTAAGIGRLSDVHQK